MLEQKLLTQGKGLYFESQDLKLRRFEATSVRLHDLYLKTEAVLIHISNEIDRERTLLVRFISDLERSCFGENSDEIDQYTNLKSLNIYRNKLIELDVTEQAINNMIIDHKPIGIEFKELVNDPNRSDRFKTFEIDTKLKTLLRNQFNKIISTLNTIFTHYNPNRFQTEEYEINLPPIIDEFNFSSKKYDLLNSLINLSFYHEDFRPTISDLTNFYDQMAIDAKNRLFKDYPSEFSEFERELERKIYSELKSKNKEKAEMFYKKLMLTEGHDISFNELIMFFTFRKHMRHKQVNI